MLQSKWFNALPFALQLPLMLVYGCVYLLTAGTALAICMAVPVWCWVLAAFAAFAAFGGFFNLF